MLDVTCSSRLSPADAAAYDAFVDEARSGSYAQARAWERAALADRRVGAKWLLVRRRGRLIGTAFVQRRLTVGGLPLPLATVERGPVTASLDDLADVLSALRSACLSRGVLRLRVMPYWSGAEAHEAERILRAAGFRPVRNFAGAHARTLRVDLAGKDDATIFAGKDGEAIRRKIRQAEKAGAVARRGDRGDIATLARLHAQIMGAQGMPSKPGVYWSSLADIIDRGARGAVFVCAHDSEPVSALYASRHGSRATFVIGAATPRPRSFSKMVPAMVAAIRWALASRCTDFDLGGIPFDDDPDEKRRSIAQFKLDFAKTPVPLVGEHVRIL
jgi:lipid II:glycine glycyltransferase (peptidoglycan interpeptide bridge formation enzyme)